jgi:hypothetical protein
MGEKDRIEQLRTEVIQCYLELIEAANVFEVKGLTGLATIYRMAAMRAMATHEEPRTAQ